MGIVWIASYPKSGNTWVRFLVHHLLYGPAESSAALNDRIPPILKNRSFAVPEGAVVCSKTHFVCVPSHPRLAETDRAIYIIRNPRDVALSSLNYRRLGGMPDSIPDARYLQAFIASRGDPEWARQGFGTWPQNIQTWTAPPPFPVLTLRYETLKAEPLEQARAIATFLSLSPTDDELQAAVDACSFTRLRDLEKSEKDTGDPDTIFKGQNQARFFMNKGLTGQRLDDIAPGLDAAFDKAFAAELDGLGYPRT